jgi:hypothetical protein
MLTVTDAALDRLTQKLTHRKAADDMALRFTRKPHGWKLMLDSSRPADTAIAHGGRNVLLMDAAVSQAMKNMTLDVRAAKVGPRLTLR